MRTVRSAGAAVLVLTTGIAMSACATTARPASVSLAKAMTVNRAAQRHHQAGQPDVASARQLPDTGNPHGHAPVPPAGRPVNTSHPAHVIGHGTAASCTSQAVVAAVAKGGIITFNCGAAPVTIVMKAMAKVRNTSRRVVLDGGGKVTLSGGGVRRILYMDTCDKRQVWTTSHCQDQAQPQLVVQNLTFRRGNSAGRLFDGGGGGAIFARGGQLKVINSRFIDNRCDRTGPDLGGAAIRALSEYKNRPVYIVHDTFRGGVCSNGGALSSIGVSWVVLNSLMTHNKDTGWGANPNPGGTPGGGSGGAIYTDGNFYTVRIDGTVISDNYAREGGGAVFFVSDNNTGTLRIEHSTLHHNPSAGFSTAGYPGIYFHSTGHPIVTDSTLS
jgi:hypothetical protein